MKQFKYISILLLLLIFTGSCKKFVEGYEDDPNAFKETNDKQVMQGVLLQNQFFLRDDGLRLAMLWMNQATGSDRQFVAFNNWNSVGNNQFNNPWAEVYSVLSEAKVLEKECDKVGNIKLRGIAKLYRAWAGGEAASLWGDVPFSQAADKENYPNPAYDNRADVFAAVQILLDEAITDLGNAVGTIYSKKDLYFSGDESKWIKIANGLKARFYLHNKDYAHAKQYALLGPASTSDDLMGKFNGYPDNSGTWHPEFSFYWNREDYMSAENAFARDLLASRPNCNEAGRKLYNYIPAGWWTKRPDLNVLPPIWAGGTGHHGKFAGDNKLVSYGEMLLIQTEAEVRNNNVAAAIPVYNTYRALLETGYDDNNGNWGAHSYPAYALADFQNGGIENADNKTEKQAFLRELFEERYIYFIGDYEAFIDHARVHGDPDVPSYMTLKSGFSGEPLRFIYPQTEIDANSSISSTIPAVTDHLPGYN